MLAAVKAAYCRQFGLEVLSVPEQSDPGHVVVDLRALGSSRRQQAAKKLRDVAVTVMVGDSAEELYQEIRVRCERFDQNEGSGC